MVVVVAKVVVKIEKRTVSFQCYNKYTNPGCSFIYAV